MDHFIPARIKWTISFRQEWCGIFHSDPNALDHWILAGMEWIISFNFIFCFCWSLLSPGLANYSELSNNHFLKLFRQLILHKQQILSSTLHISCFDDLEYFGTGYFEWKSRFAKNRSTENTFRPELSGLFHSNQKRIDQFDPFYLWFPLILTVTRGIARTQIKLSFMLGPSVAKIKLQFLEFWFWFQNSNPAPHPGFTLWSDHSPNPYCVVTNIVCPLLLLC